MYHTHRYLVQYGLPIALIVGVSLAFWQVHVPWYVFGVILPVFLMLAFVIIGMAGRESKVRDKFESLRKENLRLKKELARGDANMWRSPLDDE